MKTAIEVHDLTMSYNRKPVLWGIDFKIPEGSSTAIIGPNGAGKSTLLKGMMGLLPTVSGRISFFEKNLNEQRNLIAYVPQREEIDWDFPITVIDAVLMGRYSRLPLFKRTSAKDLEIATQALESVEMLNFKDRQIGDLSGGQQQRVFLARALAQEANIYLMDEPFAGVDAATEKAIVKLFHRLKDDGKTVICVHHDLNTVTEYFDRALLLNLTLIASGPTAEVFNSENLNKTYGGRLGLLSEIVEKISAQDWRERKTVDVESN